MHKDKKNWVAKRGFASMDPDRMREIASMGGKAAHSQGHAHEWDSDQAKAAGRIGGKRSGKKGSSGELSTD